MVPQQAKSDATGLGSRQKTIVNIKKSGVRNIEKTM
jgi:hypothetical protein